LNGLPCNVATFATVTVPAANGAEDEPLRAAAAGAEPRQPASRHKAAAAGIHLNHGSHKGGGGSAAWMPPMRLAGCLLAAACGRSASRTMRPFSGGDALDSALRGGGSRGRGEGRTAGGGEGEGGEAMPDAETSPLPPDEPPAETSIEG
jgi:hypothetical protein